MRRMRRSLKKRWMTERATPAKIPRKLPFKKWAAHSNHKAALFPMESLIADLGSGVCYLGNGIRRRQPFPKHYHRRLCLLQNLPALLRQVRNTTSDHLWITLTPLGEASWGSYSKWALPKIRSRKIPISSKSISSRRTQLMAASVIPALSQVLHSMSLPAIDGLKRRRRRRHHRHQRRQGE